MGVAGGRGHNIFQGASQIRSSDRVQRNSVWVQPQKGAAQLRRVQHSSDRVQRNSDCNALACRPKVQIHARHSMEDSVFQRISAIFRGVFSLYIIYFARRIRKAGRGGGTRSAPIFVLMSLKRRVRAAHGRARAAKTHQFVIYSHEQFPRLSFCVFGFFTAFQRYTVKIRCEEYQPMLQQIHFPACQENIRIYL